MGENNSADDKIEETAEALQGPCPSSGFESVKNIIADKLHDIAGALSLDGGRCRPDYRSDFAAQVRRRFPQ